ncbi:hypothetical protein WN943_019485 [Citrus x changshan-huyou]
MIVSIRSFVSNCRNYAGDEVDGYDETLCPIDFETQGMIVDDEINAILVRPLPGEEDIYGRIIALDQERGKEQVVGRPFHLVAVMIIKHPLTLRALSNIPSIDGSSELGGGDGVVTSLLTMLFTGGSRSGRFRQCVPSPYIADDFNLQELDEIKEPQLTAIVPFDIYAKPFSL